MVWYNYIEQILFAYFHVSRKIAAPSCFYWLLLENRVNVRHTILPTNSGLASNSPLYLQKTFSMSFDGRKKSATNHGIFVEWYTRIWKSFFALKGFSPDEWITRAVHQDKYRVRLKSNFHEDAMNVHNIEMTYFL